MLDHKTIKSISIAVVAVVAVIGAGYGTIAAYQSLFADHARKPYVDSAVAQVKSETSASVDLLKINLDRYIEDNKKALQDLKDDIIIMNIDDRIHGDNLYLIGLDAKRERGIPLTGTELRTYDLIKASIARKTIKREEMQGL